MRKVACSLVLTLAVSLSACCSSLVEKRAVDNLEKTHDLIFPEYIALVKEKHGAGSDDTKDREKLVESARHIVEGMKAKVGE